MALSSSSRPLPLLFPIVKRRLLEQLWRLLLYVLVLPSLTGCCHRPKSTKVWQPYFDDFPLEKVFWTVAPYFCHTIPRFLIVSVFGECGTKVWRHSPKKPPSGNRKKWPQVHVPHVGLTKTTWPREERTAYGLSSWLFLQGQSMRWRPFIVTTSIWSM